MSPKILPWTRWLLSFVIPSAKVQNVVMGMRPGYVWDDAAGQWVDEEVTWAPGPGTYSLVGPVYVVHGIPL